MNIPDAQLRRWLPGLGAGIGFCYILLFTATYGMGTNPDGVYYVSVARSLLAGSGFIGFDETLFVHWPPFYPMVLAAVGWLGVDPQEGVRYVHALLIGGTLYVALNVLRQHVKSTPWLLGGAIALVVSKPIVYVGIRAMTEPLFGLLVLVFVLGLIAFVEKPSWLLLFGIASCAGLAFLTRYMGFACVLMGVGVLLAQPQSWFKRVQQTFLFSTIACLPVGLWLLRNVYHTGTLTGTRYASDYGIGANIGMLLEAIGLFFFPDEVPLGIRHILVVGLMAGLSIGSYQVWRAQKGEGVSARLVRGMSTWSLTYIALLLVIRSLFASDILNVRLLYPVYVPLLISGILLVDHYRERVQARRWLYRLMVAGYSLWLLYPVAYTARIGYFSFTRGSAGFAYQEWADSPLLDGVQRYATEGRLYSNYAGAIHWHANLTARYSAQLYKGYPERNQTILRAFSDTIRRADNPVFLVWIDHPISEERYIASFASPDELTAYLTVREVERFQYGVVYELQPK